MLVPLDETVQVGSMYERNAGEQLRGIITQLFRVPRR